MIIRTNFQVKPSKEELFSNDLGKFPFHCLYVDSSGFIGDIFPWHWHTAFEIDYIAGCDVRFDFAGTSLYVPQGNAIFINSGEIHSYQPQMKEGCKIYAFLFELAFLSGDYNNAMFQKYITPVINAKLTALKISPDMSFFKVMSTNIANMIQLCSDESDYYEFQVHSELGEFWCCLIEELKLQNEFLCSKSRDNERIRKMLDFIHSNYCNPLSLQEIAAAATIGTRECSRCFRRSIGRSPVDYLNDYRVQMAIRLLVTTDKNITEISETTGFSSISYFGKVFKQHTGVSPLQYRASV